MPTLSVPIDLFIDDIKSHNNTHGYSNDVSGIVIFDVNNNGGDSWNIDDSTYPGTPIYDETDISDAVFTSAYFLPYSDILSLELIVNSLSSTNNYIDFYLIPSASMVNFTSPRVNLNTVFSSIDTNTIYRIFNDYMDAPSPSLIDPIILTPPATLETYTTSTLPIVSAYTPAQVDTLYNIQDSGYRVVELKSEQTIAAEVKTYLGINGRLPQFKNYSDYLAYKNAINLQNGLLQRYG